MKAVKGKGLKKFEAEKVTLGRRDAEYKVLPTLVSTYTTSSHFNHLSFNALIQWKILPPLSRTLNTFPSP